MEWEERRRKIRQEEEERRAKREAKKKKEPNTRSINMYMAAFGQGYDIPEGLDHNSFEVIRKCRYIRTDSPVQLANKQHRIYKHSSWAPLIPVQH